MIFCQKIKHDNKNVRNCIRKFSMVKSYKSDQTLKITNLTYEICDIECLFMSTYVYMWTYVCMTDSNMYERYRYVCQICW
jgi:hypothetical protein